jgi:hypothetical protein
MGAWLSQEDGCFENSGSFHAVFCGDESELSTTTTPRHWRQPCQTSNSNFPLASSSTRSRQTALQHLKSPILSTPYVLLAEDTESPAANRAMVSEIAEELS